MTKIFTSDFEGCTGGEVMPRLFRKGEAIPADLLAAAEALGIASAATAKPDAAAPRPRRARRQAATTPAG